MTRIYSYASIDELERHPGPSQDLTGSRIKVLDILLIKQSSSYGRQVAISTSKGFCWAALEEVQRTTPDIWKNYVWWYEGQHNTHPLEALGHSSDSSASDTDEPRTRQYDSVVKREVLFLVELLLRRSSKFRLRFIEASSLVRARVGAFLHFKRALTRWRDVTYFQDQQQGARSHWKGKQFIVCFSKWRSTTLAAVTDTRRAHQIESSVKSRWFKKMLTATEFILVAKASFQLSVTTILKKHLKSWQHIAELSSKVILYEVAAKQHFRFLRLKIYLQSWRIYIESCMKNIIRPLRSAFFEWQLSVKLTIKLNLYNRWMIRNLFSRWFNKERIKFNRRQKQVYMNKWRLIQNHKSSAVIHTTSAYIHQHSRFLVQSWRYWIDHQKHVLVDTGLINEAILHQQNCHLASWSIYAKVRKEATHNNELSLAFFEHKALLRAMESWSSHYDQIQMLVRTITFKNERDRTKSWTEWRYWARKRRGKLERLENKLQSTPSLQWVYADLENTLPNDLWTPYQIATSYNLKSVSKNLKQAWLCWNTRKTERKTIDTSVYQRILRQAPATLERWVDASNWKRFLKKLKSRLMGTKNTITEQRAKRKAVWFVIVSKTLALRTQRCIHRWYDIYQTVSEVDSDSDQCSEEDSGTEEENHFLSPTTSDAWKTLKNITTTKHGLTADQAIPVHHIAAPVSSWNKKLSKNVSIVNQYSKLQVPGSTLSQVTASRIPTVSVEDIEMLSTPFKLWSSNLDEQEYVMADLDEIMLSYTFIWGLPLWFDSINGEYCLVLWDCCNNTLTSIPAERCLPDVNASDEDVSRLFTTFQGEHFAVPYTKLDGVDNITTPLTVQGLTAVEANNVSHIASPLSNLETSKLGTDESATDMELLKAANRENAALLRSPFLEKDKSKLPEPKHVSSRSNSEEKQLTVSVMQVVKHATSDLLGTVNAIEKNNVILVRWDNDPNISEVQLADITPFNDITEATLIPSKNKVLNEDSATQHPLSVFDSETKNLNIDEKTIKCYNPICNSFLTAEDHSCQECNFPKDRLSFYCSNNHLTDPAKKWCQEKGCGAVNIHFLTLSEQATLKSSLLQQTASASESSVKLFSNRHPSLRTKLVFLCADHKAFLLLRAGQTEDALRWSRTMTADQYLCRMIDTEVGPLHRKDNNMNKFRIIHSWRVYYKTCNIKLGGSKHFGLHAIDFDEQLSDETSSDVMVSFDFTGAVILEPAKESKFTDINHWERCHRTMNRWLGWHLQSTWEAELNACVTYIKHCYMDSYLLSIRVDVTFCEQVLNAVHKDFTAELRLFVSDKEQHAARYPDTIWVFSGHQFKRPKLWIESKGTERASFLKLFREVREIKEIQEDRLTKIKVSKDETRITNLEKALAAGKVPKKTHGSDIRENNWSSQKSFGAVNVSNILSSQDYHLAAEEYKRLCNTLNNGEFKEALSACWRNSTQTGCRRKSCKNSHQILVPKAIAAQWKRGELVAAAYGGFESTPVRHNPNDITSVVTALKKKLDKADNVAQGAQGEAPSVPVVKKAKGVSPPMSTDKIVNELDSNDPLIMGETTSSLLLVRPDINVSNWTASNQVLHLGTDQIKVNSERKWSCIFPGRLGSEAIIFGGKEKDLGQNLNGETNRCMILTEGAVTDSGPTDLLKGYRRDGKLLREHLPDGHNSMIKLHLDLLEMDVEGVMPDNEELTSDLLLRSQPLSYHHSQILEQTSTKDRATVIVDQSASCEADKVKRPAISFICLVGSEASPSSIVKFRKTENNHATFLDEAYFKIGEAPLTYFKTLSDFIQFCRPIEPICRCSFKPCVTIQSTMTDFEKVTWPTFLPASQLGRETEFDVDYYTVGDLPESGNVEDASRMLTKFRHATALRNPEKISLDEFIYYIEDEVANLQKLTKSKEWNQVDLLHFDWYCFPVDDTRRRMYAIWEQDALELENSESFMKNFRLAFALVLRAWGFEANGSKYSEQSLNDNECGKWNGNYMRLYKLGRSAWLLNQQTELISAQKVALQLCPSKSFKAFGFDLSHFYSFSLQTSETVKKASGSELSIDQQLIHLAAQYNQQLTIASSATNEYVDSKEWFTEHARIMTELVDCIDVKYKQDHLKMLVRYTRLYTPDASGPAADADRIQRLLVDNPAIQLESVLARRLITSHRYGVAAEMECSRDFRESVVNPTENSEFAELICKASRKLIVRGMKLFFPEKCIPTICKWKGILLSPNLIVFTEKKPEGRICQAMSANSGDAPNDLMVDHKLLPCVYDHALQATRAIYSMKDELESICNMVPGWELDQKLMHMTFLSMAYVDDFHIVCHDTKSTRGGGTDLKQAFNWTNLNEDAVGIIATRLEIPEEWSDAMSNTCVIIWLVLNFGWIHSPSHHQAVPVAVRNAVNHTCTKDLLTSLPGYKFKPTDLPHLAMEALFRYIRYTVGYIETIDFDKTQDIEGKLHRLGCTMFLDTLEIAVKENHLQRALAAVEQGNEFEQKGLKGVPLGWLQTTLGQFRFAAVMPKSWIMGFIVPLLRCLKGVKSNAPKTTLCCPSLPFQSDEISLDNMHKCRRTLVVILKLMLKNPQCARLPMYLLLPPAEVIQRVPTERIIFCGHDACDQGLATLVWDPNEEGVIRALIISFTPEIRRLLYNSRHAELREHDKDFLCMGNLEHSCITTNMLQFPEKYDGMLALHVSDNQPTVGCTNKGFGSNFTDQEMCRLEALLQVQHTSQQLTIWVQTWLNELLDALSRMYIDGVLQQSVMETIALISNKLNITLEFEAPNADVTTFLQWLESDKRDQLSLVDKMESSILSNESSAALNLHSLTTNKSGGRSSCEEQCILPKSESGACSVSVLEIASLTSSLVENAVSTNSTPMLAAHICCGFGGMSIGSIMAGFVPILNVENNIAAVKFHEALTAGFICCGDMDDLNFDSLPRVHNMTVGFPCPPHTCLGRRKGWNDNRCRVKAVVKLILATLPYSVFGECVPGLLTSCNGKVFKHIIDELSPHYHIHYEVMKFAQFDHRSNRRRLIMAMLLKSVVAEPNFSTFPRGHIEDLTRLGPVSDCLVDSSTVHESHYVSGSFTVLPTGVDPTGRLVYTHSMDGIKGAGTPKCPAAVFDSRGLAPTQLATVFANEEEFGVNTGLTLRRNKKSETISRPSRLTTQEQVNIGNFPYDTIETAHALGLSENQVSSGVNNAVPPSVCYPIAEWFKSTLLSALESVDIEQTNKHAPYCGIDQAQQWISQVVHPRDRTLEQQRHLSQSCYPSYEHQACTEPSCQYAVGSDSEVVCDVGGGAGSGSSSGSGAGSGSMTQYRMTLGRYHEAWTLVDEQITGGSECFMNASDVEIFEMSDGNARDNEIFEMNDERPAISSNSGSGSGMGYGLSAGCGGAVNLFVLQQTLNPPHPESSGAEFSSDYTGDGPSCALRPDVKGDKLFRIGIIGKYQKLKEIIYDNFECKAHFYSQGLEELVDTIKHTLYNTWGGLLLRSASSRATLMITLTDSINTSLSAYPMSLLRKNKVSKGLTIKLGYTIDLLADTLAMETCLSDWIPIVEQAEGFRQRNTTSSAVESDTTHYIYSFATVFDVDAIASETFPLISFVHAGVPDDDYLVTLPDAGLSLMAFGDPEVVKFLFNCELYQAMNRRRCINLVRCEYLGQHAEAIANVTSRIPAVCKAWYNAFAAFMKPRASCSHLAHIMRVGTNNILRIRTERFLESVKLRASLESWKYKTTRDRTLEQHRHLSQSCYHSFEHPMNSLANPCATPETLLPINKLEKTKQAARELHVALATATLSNAAVLTRGAHALTEWKINMNCFKVQSAIAALRVANNALQLSPSHDHMQYHSMLLPSDAAMHQQCLKEEARSIMEQRTLSPGKIATLPPDLMVELATELSAATRKNLSSRFRVKFWLTNPEEAEASGNDWSVADDCNELTTQLVDAWLALQEQGRANMQAQLQTNNGTLCWDSDDENDANSLAMFDESQYVSVKVNQERGTLDQTLSETVKLESELRISELRRETELCAWAARVAWRQLMQSLPLLIFRYMTSTHFRATKEAMDLLSRATSQLLQPLANLAVEHSDSKCSPPNLLSILNHSKIAPTLIREIHAFPQLCSRARLEDSDSDSLGKICETVTYNDRGRCHDVRTSRVMVWNQVAGEKPLLRQQLIDDCRSSMVTLSVKAIKTLKANIAGVCRQFHDAVNSAITMSVARARIMKMCSKQPVVTAHRIVYDDILKLLSLWATRARCAQLVLTALTKATPPTTSEDEIVTMVTNPAPVQSTPAATVYTNNTNSTTPKTSSTTKHVAEATVNGSSQHSGYSTKVVSYLGEERLVLREFFNNRLGRPGEHIYLASSAIKSLPSGTYNPCDPNFRNSDFEERLPMKKKTGSDVAIGQLTKLLPDRPELHHVHICSRSPMAATLARALLKKSITITLPSPTKAGGWDNIPTSSIVFNPMHPTRKGIRKVLGTPDQAEIDAENEFESEIMGASLGGETENKYKGWMLQFNEYCKRHAVELLIEANHTVDAKLALTNLRYWARRFFLSEGAIRGLQYSSINCKAYAIRWHFLINYGLDVLADWVEHKIFMRGLKRVRHNPQRKVPVSWALLMWLVRQLGKSARDMVIKAAVLVGWWFLCRISEIISFKLGSVRFFNSTGDLLDIQTANLDEAVEVDLLFAVTKNDVDGEGAIRTHSKVLSKICVVSALAELVTARRSAENEMDLMSPLFKFFDDSKDSVKDRSITRATMVRVLKAAATAAGIPKARVSCHSLRSGGAVAMLSVSGSSYSDVRLFGRWRSDCARIYLRAVRGMMTSVSARMAANSTDCTVMMAGGSRQKRY